MSQSEHAHNYEYLNAMSTEQLRELLLLEIESDQDHDELVFHILEVIQGRKKEDDPRQISWQQARAEFDKYYNTPDGKGQQLYPMEAGQSEVSLKQKKPGKIIRFVATAAAVLAVVFLTVPPVFGYSDVWDMVARWTDDVLQLKHQASEQTTVPEPVGVTDSFTSFKSALESQSIYLPISPTTIPIDFSFERALVQTRPVKNEAVITAIYRHQEGKTIAFVVTKRNTLSSRSYEKDDTFVENYLSGGVEHILYSNFDRVAAVWQIDNCECSVSANITLDQLKIMIDSIYEGVS